MIAAITAPALAVAGAVGIIASSAHADTAPPNPALPQTVSADVLPTVQINGVAWSQVTVGNTVYVAGSFSKARPAGVSAGGAGEVSRNNLLAYDITTGNLITSFNHNLNAQGLTITASPDGSTVYVGGNFTQVDGVTHNHVAAFSTSTGALISSFTANLNSTVHALSATNSTVYIGGGFTSANGTARSHLAAFTASTGALTSWKPTTDAVVTAMVMAPDQSRVVVAGQWSNLDAVARPGIGAVDAVTGALEPWDPNYPINDHSTTSDVTSLSADATQVYGTSYYYTQNGNFEGRFAIDPDTGHINWMNSCHGDSYDAFPIGQVLYSASHEHECSDIGAFSQDNLNVLSSTHHYAAAETTFPTGTLMTPLFQGVGFGPPYYSFAGEPSGTQLDWYPTFTAGTYTGQGQAAWSVTGNSNYVSYGGEFPTVNGIKQQGLVRFAVRSIAPNKVGPTSSSTLTPSAVSQTSGTARVTWQATWDQDNTRLRYDLYRDGGSTAIYTTTFDSAFWNRPMLGYVDTGLAVGSSHTYRVRITDPLGNTLLSATSAAVTIGSTPAPTGYTATVLADGAMDFWPLNEASGTTAQDLAGFNDITLGSAVTLGAAGPMPSTTSATFTGAQPTVVNKVFVASPSVAGTPANVEPMSTYSVEAWVSTTSTSGGVIVGDGLYQLNDSAAVDRVLYFDDSGHILFGADSGSHAAITSTNAYNDGTWHHVVGTLGAAGGQLYVDGALVASNATMTEGRVYDGHWRIGGDSLAKWPSAHTSGYLAGSIADVAVYPSALSASQVAAHYGSPVANQPPVAAFTPSCTLLACGFDATASSDVDGTITSYAWDFGDGGTDTSATPSHTYAADGTYTVTLTVTDNDGATNSVSHDVTVSSVLANVPPVASFTQSCTNLVCSFDGSASSDSDGTIASYAWDFGDGGTDTTATPSHTFAAGGTYTVKLTVTDNGAASATTSSAVTVSAANQSPIAVFSSSCTNLGCTFDGSSSADPDGTIASYAWDFGDGGTGMGVKPLHTFASGGNYTVKLTVTDNLGATTSTSSAVTVSAPANTAFATDTFNRTLSPGWGSADLGGAWTGSGSTANLSVTPGTGRMSLAKAGMQIGVVMAGVSSSDTELDTTITTSQAATGGGLYAYIVGRRVDATHVYEARVRFTSTKTVAIELVLVNGSTTTVLAGETTLSGVTYTPGMLLNLRLQVTGTSPTALHLKVWPAASSEPANWQLNASDSTAGLQTPGSLGFTGYLSGSTTLVPVVLSVSALTAKPTA